MRLLRPRLLTSGLLLIGLLVGCTFEHRGNGEDLPPAEGDTLVLDGPEAGVEFPRPGPTATVRAFREAVSVGDLSLALSLLDRQAFLVDDLVGDPESAGTRGEALLELRSRLAAGVTLHEENSRVNYSEQGAVVLTRLRIEAANGATEEALEMEGRALTETAVLILTEEGWRIAHFHRSLLPGS